MLVNEKTGGVAAAAVRESSRPQLFASEGKRAVLLTLVLCAVTLIVYNPATHHDFVNYDDNFYVTQNLIVQHGLTWPGVKWAFTTFEVANWHPLTWLSHMVDYSMYGPFAGGHHLTSLFLHTLNTLLVFLFLLPLAMTMALLWKAKEVILESVFSGQNAGSPPA